jgi:hypothetical protein
MTLAIALAEATDEREVGGKARNLARLIALDVPVPAGMVLTRTAFDAFVEHNGLTDRLERLTRALAPSEPERLRRTAEAIRTLVMTATLPASIQHELHTIAERVPVERVVAVRSSVIGEDGTDASFAGQFDSILGVRSEAELRHALLACWASSWSARALFYRTARRLSFNGMAVIVEQQVAARISGVLFTRTPDGLAQAGPDDLIIEYSAGLGNQLVSGRIDPHRLVVSRATLTVQTVSFPDAESVGDEADTSFAPEQVLELSRRSLRLETELKAPQDIEWAIDHDGVMWILQARPITTPAGGGGGDPNRASDVLWSNANVNENFPRPISPLLYSLAEAGYYHYFRNLGLAFGVSRHRLRAMDRRLAAIIGVHGARMYYNLTNIHAVLRMAPFGERLAAAFNQFVGADETAAQPPDASSWDTHRGRMTQAAELLRIAAHITWQFLFLRRRVQSFERTADRFATRIRPECFEGRPLAALAGDLHEFLDIRCHRWKNASLADTAAMVLYALLQRALAGEGTSTLHNRLLRGLPGVPSSIQPLRLWALSRIVRSDSLHRLFTGEAADVLRALRHTGQFAPFRRELDQFLADWGFRSSAELMLTEPSLQEDPRPVIDLLKGYAAMDGESPETAIARQAAERRAETWRLLRGLATRSPVRAAWVAFLLPRTQRAVVYRERVRLKQALLYTRCRAIALAIGDELVRRSVLAHRDDVFMLTVQEVGDLTAGRSMFPYHVADLIALRRRDHDRLVAMRPPDTVRLAEGYYLRPDVHTDAERLASAKPNDATTLRGTSACGGSTTAPAAVLTDVREAHHLHVATCWWPGRPIRDGPRCSV